MAKKKVTEGKVELTLEGNNFTKRIENVEEGKDSFYFRWNGKTVMSDAQLELRHVYNFMELPPRAKVHIIHKYLKERFLVVEEMNGRAGVVVNGAGLRDGMTSRQIAALDFVQPTKETVTHKTLNRAKSFSGSDKEAIVEVRVTGLPAEWVPVVQEITKEEFDKIKVKQSVIGVSTQTAPIRGE